MKKERSDSCMESTGSRLDSQKEDRERRKQAFLPVHECVCVCVCVCVIDNGSCIEILHKLGSES